jgi:glycosyltransferase involved in cell wall biosynthesis
MQLDACCNYLRSKSMLPWSEEACAGYNTTGSAGSSGISIHTGKDGMRIVIDVRTISDHFPGIGRYTYHLVRCLAKLRDRDELLLAYNPEIPNTRFDVGALAAEPGVRIVPTTARPFTMREQLRLPYELYKLSPDVTHFPYPIMPYAAPRPGVLTIHDIIPLRCPKLFSIRQRILYRISLSLALRSASLVICPSEATLADLKSKFETDTSRLYVVHEGVSESFRPCAKDEVERARNAYGLPERYLLYVGSNKPHKNLSALVNAYARLQAAPPLVIAGAEDPRYMQTRRKIETLGLGNRVLFAGAIKEPDLPALYCGAHAFIFPSLYEGFGLPPLEAMACGTPVACSNIPSLSETVGNSALLFDAEDAGSISAAIGRLVDDESLRSELRERGLRRAAAMSWDCTAQKTLDLYKRAAVIRDSKFEIRD